MLDAMDKVPEYGRKAMGQSPMVMERAHAMRNRDYQIAKEYGLPVREDIQLARQIFAEKGIEGLREALKSGAVLPAAAVAILGTSLMQGEGGQQ
jgi:type III secretory pathway component EscU